LQKTLRKTSVVILSADIHAWVIASLGKGLAIDHHFVPLPVLRSFIRTIAICRTSSGWRFVWNFAKLHWRFVYSLVKREAREGS
jgi:hypothetical protein